MIVFFDLETTGTHPVNDRIVSLATLKVDSLTDVGESKHILLNPGMPIPPGATEVHGITDAMVADKPPFASYAKKIFEYLADCDYGGYNIVNFDVPLLAEEFHRCGYTWPRHEARFYDACHVFKAKEERTLSAALQFYCQRPHDVAHDALGDVLATRDVLLAQMQRYDDLSTPEQYSAFCFNPNALDLAGKIVYDEAGQPVYSFGKDKGKRVREHQGFALWMLKGDFPTNTKMVLRKILGYK